MSSLSKSLYQLSVLCIFLVDLVVCQYRWDCTAPDHNGQRYIPSERDRNAPSVITDGNSLHIYRVSNLDASCYGPVTAIEYCYRYSTTIGSGQPAFNWTVLILEDTGSNFVINGIYDITSRLPVSSENCTNDGAQLRTCCDRTNIEGFDLPTSNFVFGVTESAQGNTHEAALLGVTEALPQYRVDVVLINRAEVTLSIGSTIRNRSPTLRGIRMLWFVIGVSPTEAPPHTTIISTSPMLSMAATDSRSIITATTNVATSLVSTTIMLLNATSSVSTSTNAATVSGALLGGVAGSISLLFLAALLLLLLALVWTIKKYKVKKADENEGQCNLDHQKPKKHEEQREIGQQQQRQDDEAIEMKSSDAYMLTAQQIQTEDNVVYGLATPQIPTEDNVAYGLATPQIPTEDNVAYGQATPQISMEDNVAYGQATPQIPTEDNYYCQIESNYQNECEYEYIS